MKTRKNGRPFGAIGIVGSILSVIGIALLSSRERIFDFILQSIFVLTPDSAIHSAWQKTPVEIPTNFYFFNWTNKDDFYNLSVRPKFEEVGPYTLQQTIEKVDITWNHNHTVTFKQVHYYRYDDDPQGKNINEEVTSINFVYMASAHYARYWNELIKNMVGSILESLGSDYYITKTANEFILEGYENHIVNILHYMPALAPEIPHFEKFGWLAIRNGSVDFDGIFNIANGEKNRNFDLLNWNYLNITPFYGDECNGIESSLADLHSARNNRDYVDIFIPEVCRKMRFEFEREEEVNGILGYKYSVQDRVIDNGTKYPENKCYCNGDCIPSGMLNVSACRYGVNVYISMPHFHLADPFYLNAVEGLHPNNTDHESYLILEPTTFLPLKLKARIQFNQHVHPIHNVGVFENAPSVFFPIAWLEQSFVIPNQTAKYLKIFLMVPHFFLAAGIVLILSGVILILLAAYKLRKIDDLVKNEIGKQENVPLNQQISRSGEKCVM